MSAPSALDQIEAYLDGLEAGLQLGDPAELDLPQPDLDGATLAATDAERARAILRRLHQVQERTEGQRVRMAGEIAGLRQRSVNDGHRRSPSTFDTSL